MLTPRPDSSMLVPPVLQRLVFTEAELGEIRSLQAEISGRFSCAADPALPAELAVLAQELPRRLRRFLNDFRLAGTPQGACVISGYPIDESRIGDTPSHWLHGLDRQRTFPEQAFLLLAATLLGDAFGWSTLQRGRLVTDIFPIQQFADEQLGTSSRQPLYWHTEDAFHPYRSDYVALFCLRNREDVGTLISSMDQIALSEPQVRVLFERRFLIFPDSSHAGATASGQVAEAPVLPAPVAVLFGEPQSPYLRIDPLMMRSCANDEEAQQALEWLISGLDAALFELKIRPGDLVVLDNYMTVHGRRAFSARYDGTDRWFKRVLVTRDLRASRQIRASATSRVIETK